MVDIRPHIRSLTVLESAATSLVGRGVAAHVVEVELAVVEQRGARPSEIVALLNLSPEQVHIVRTTTHLQPPRPSGAAPEPSTPIAESCT